LREDGGGIEKRRGKEANQRRFREGEEGEVESWILKVL